MAKCKIPPVHLIKNPADHLITPEQGGRAWMINDPKAPKRGGVYLPRVWWMNNVLKMDKQINNYLKMLTPMYGINVRELSANALYDWLREYGPMFGWEQITGEFRMLEAQQLANASPPGMLWGVVDYLDVENSLRYKPKSGKTYCNVYCCDVCHLTSYAVIIAGWNRLGPGHICAVLPETKGIEAGISHPIITEAGGINHKATNSGKWWNIKNKNTDFGHCIAVWVNKGENNE